MKRAVVGVDPGYVSDLAQAFQWMKKEKFKFLCGPVRNLLNLRERKPDEPYFPWYCLALKDPTELHTSVVGRLSDLEKDLAVEGDVGKKAGLLLQEELDFFVYLGLQAIIVELNGIATAELARMSLNIRLKKGPIYGSKFWAKVKLGATTGTGSLEVEGQINSLQIWNSYRQLCKNYPKIYPILEFTSEIPSEREVECWLKEMVTAIYLPTSIFTTNLVGYPILPPAHHEILQRFMEHGVENFIVHIDHKISVGSYFYRGYVKHVWRKLHKDKKAQSVSECTAHGGSRHQVNLNDDHDIVVSSSMSVVNI